MKLGTMVELHPDTLEQSFASVREMGLLSCQLYCWQSNRMTPANALRVREVSAHHSIEISAFWCGWDGPCEWNLTRGPSTIGLVPSAYRHGRLNALLVGSDFCEAIGVTDLITHVGFIPNDPGDKEYIGLVGALRHLALALKPKKQHFLFETGQETPTTLLRTIEDIGCENVGINLDPANLLMYGMGNPIDALAVFGHLVRNVHGKDGGYPPNGRELGAEKPIGQGMVDYPRFIRSLRAIGYDRFLTIEREISGDEQTRDIKAAARYLEDLWSSPNEGDKEGST
jgi:L-ribulose-5-phosphate 3-epimerase